MNKREIKRENNRDNEIIIKVCLINEKKKEGLSTLLRIPSVKYFREHKSEVRLRGVQEICNREKVSGKELLEKGFNKIEIKFVSK